MGGEAAGSSGGRLSAGMPGSVTGPGCLEPRPTLPGTRSELPASILSSAMLFALLSCGVLPQDGGVLLLSCGVLPQDGEV